MLLITVREHAHVVGARAVHALGRRGHAADEVAPAQNQTAFDDAEVVGLFHVVGDLADGVGMNSHVLTAGQRLALSFSRIDGTCSWLPGESFTAW